MLYIMLYIMPIHVPPLIILSATVLSKHAWRVQIHKHTHTRFRFRIRIPFPFPYRNGFRIRFSDFPITLFGLPFPLSVLHVRLGCGNGNGNGNGNDDGYMFLGTNSTPGRIARDLILTPFFGVEKSHQK
jgi:hypothetical protein